MNSGTGFVNDKAYPLFGKIDAPNPDAYDDASETRIFKVVLYHCFLVLGGPIVAFFVTKILLLSPLFQWGSEEIKTDVVSAIVAGTILISTHSSILHYVTFHILFAEIVLHIALGMYIVKAYRGETDTKQQMGKRD